MLQRLDEFLCYNKVLLYGDLYREVSRGLIKKMLVF